MLGGASVAIMSLGACGGGEEPAGGPGPLPETVPETVPAQTVLETVLEDGDRTTGG